MKSVRNQMDVKAVKGATPRAYETHPKPKGKVFNGTEVKLKAGKKL